MRAKQWLAVGVIGWSMAVSVCIVGAAEAKWDVGIRDTLLRGFGAPDAWSAADAIGVSLIEVNVNAKMKCLTLLEGDQAPYSLDSPEERQALKAKLTEKKKAICAFCAGYNYGKSASDEEGVKWLGQVAEAARDLGVPVVMVPLPGVREMKDEEYIERSKKFLGALVPIAEKTGVQFAIENLQMFANRVEVAEPILKTLPPSRVGIALDITNMYWYGHPLDKLYGFAETLAPYVRYCHAKNERYPDDQKNVQRQPGWEYGKYAVSIRDGDIDFRRILRIYAKGGFKGTVTIEDDSLGKLDEAGKKKTLIDDVKFLREIIAGL